MSEDASKYNKNTQEVTTVHRKMREEKEKMDMEEMCNACARGDMDKVEYLLGMGVNVNGFNQYNRTPIQVVKKGHTRLLLLLLERGADPNVPDPSCGRTLLHDASYEGFADAVRVLLEYGADASFVDAQGNLPVHLAEQNGHEDVVQVLVGVTAENEQAN